MRASLLGGLVSLVSIGALTSCRKQLEQEMEVSIRKGIRAYVNGQVLANNNIENRGRRSQNETLRQQISAWRNEISSLRH